MTIWIFLLTLIQSMFAPYISINSITPDLFFVFVLCYSLKEKNIKKIIIVSVICGLLMDCMCGRILGNYIAIYLICAVLINYLGTSIYKNGILTSIILILLFGIFGKSLYFITNIGILKETGYLYFLVNVIIPESFYNMVISFVMLFLLKLTFWKNKDGVIR